FAAGANRRRPRRAALPGGPLRQGGGGARGRRDALVRRAAHRPGPVPEPPVEGQRARAEGVRDQHPRAAGVRAGERPRGALGAVVRAPVVRAAFALAAFVLAAFVLAAFAFATCALAGTAVAGAAFAHAARARRGSGARGAARDDPPGGSATSLHPAHL